jgi:hypothetical protein
LPKRKHRRVSCRKSEFRVDIGFEILLENNVITISFYLIKRVKKP